MRIVTTIGDGQTEIDLRGLGPKETLVLQDGRRLAPDGFAGYKVGANSFFDCLQSTSTCFRSG